MDFFCFSAIFKLYHANKKFMLSNRYFFKNDTANLFIQNSLIYMNLEYVMAEPLILYL